MELYLAIFASVLPMRALASNFVFTACTSTGPGDVIDQPCMLFFHHGALSGHPRFRAAHAGASFHLRAYRLPSNGPRQCDGSAVYAFHSPWIFIWPSFLSYMQPMRVPTSKFVFTVYASNGPRRCNRPVVYAFFSHCTFSGHLRFRAS